MAEKRTERGRYAAEVYAPHRDPAEQCAAAERIRSAAETSEQMAAPVRYLDALHLPGEETVFYVFEADDPAAIARVLLAAGFEAERITPAMTFAGDAREERDWRPGAGPAVAASTRR